jgi:mediator of RNA polymerase II transcription subunit 17
MGSIPNNFPVSLKTWPSSNSSDRNDLSKIIERINIERGGFQNITEESLRQEIAEAELDSGSENDSSDAESEEEPDRLKQLMTARDEIIGQVEYVIQDISVLTTANRF